MNNLHEQTANGSPGGGLLDNHWSNEAAALLRFPTVRVFVRRTEDLVTRILQTTSRHSRPTFIIDASLENHPETTRIREIFGPRDCVRISAEPTLRGLNAALRAVPHDTDSIVAIGGGSTLDAAKYLRREVSSALGRHLPLIGFPTLPGSGAEVSRNVVAIDASGGKTATRMWRDAPDYAIWNSSFGDSTPDHLLILGAFDAAMHLLETVTLAFERHRVLDTYINSGLDVLRTGVHGILSGSYERRADAIQDLQQASVVGGDTISLLRTGLIHSLGEAFARFVPGTAHPLSLAVFAPAVFASIPSEAWARLPESVVTLRDMDYWAEAFGQLDVSDRIKRVHQSLCEVPTDELLSAVEGDSVIFKEHLGGLSRAECHRIIQQAKAMK